MNAVSFFVSGALEFAFGGVLKQQYQQRFLLFVL